MRGTQFWPSNPELQYLSNRVGLVEGSILAACSAGADTIIYDRGLLLLAGLV